MRADWQGNNGELYELFKYSDGKIQARTWYLVSHADESSSGSASDVVGQAQIKKFGIKVGEVLVFILKKITLAKKDGSH